MNEITINSAIIESEVIFNKYESTVAWTLTIEASDDKKYIYVEDEETFPTYDLVKEYFLGEVDSDLGEKAYFQLLAKINLL
jgi:hypothetical protein